MKELLSKRFLICTYLIFSVFFLEARSHAAGQIALKVGMSPAGSFVAESKELQGKVLRKDSKLEVSGVILNLETLSSGLKLRDQHMKDKYFEVKRYPIALLRTAEPSKEPGKFKGVLSLRQVDVPIEGNYEWIGPVAEAKEVKVQFKTKLSAMGISPQPSYLGVTVDDDVTVEVKLPVENGKSG